MTGYYIMRNIKINYANVSSYTLSQIKGGCFKLSHMFQVQPTGQCVVCPTNRFLFLALCGLVNVFEADINS